MQEVVLKEGQELLDTKGNTVLIEKGDKIIMQERKLKEETVSVGEAVAIIEAEGVEPSVMIQSKSNMTIALIQDAKLSQLNTGIEFMSSANPDDFIFVPKSEVADVFVQKEYNTDILVRVAFTLKAVTVMVDFN